MKRQSLMLLVLAALVVISGALYVSAQRNRPRAAPGTALFPGLANDLNGVTGLSILKGNSTPAVTIHRQGELWTVAERADYPADVPKLRKLLLSLREAKIREQKTADPAKFPLIGVEDPSLPDASGAQIEVTAPDGKHAVIVGKPTPQGSFVRRRGENTSFIVEPSISFETQPRYWIDGKLLDLPAAKIQSIAIKPASGPGYSLRRAAAGPNGDAAGTAGTAAAGVAPAAASSDFTLQAVPAGRQAATAQTLAASATAFGGLVADDVAAASAIDCGAPAIATVTLSAGDSVTVTGCAGADKHWIEVAASQDAAFEGKAAGRAFEISAYRYDNLFRPLEQLLLPLPVKPPGKTPASAAAPGKNSGAPPKPKAGFAPAP